MTKVFLCAILCVLCIDSPAEEIGAEAPVFIVNALEDESGGQSSAAPRHFSTFQPFNFSTSSPLHGAMIGQLRTDEDWDTLASWGARLVRHQIVCKGEGPATNRAVYAAAWRTNFARELDRLGESLRQAGARGLKVCIDQHSFPGGRSGEGDPEEWGRDARMFHDPFFADLFVECWTNLVARVTPYRDIIYGYDLMNEPRQERPAAEGCDLHSLQTRCASAIRAIDPDTPIVVGSMHNDPGWFRKFIPLDLPNVIYEVHVYYPHDYTHQGILTPLDRVEDWPDPKKGWDKDFLRKSLAPVLDFQRRHGVRILAGEFSAVTWAPNAEGYIRDCIELFDEFGWDWCYHAYREARVWNVELESVRRGLGTDDFRPAADTPRKRALLEGLAK
ncbi:MAG: cellulase family glycosylhydrolase [Kiritimatiellae bacterium]|nr:cellulase family glycosylhydrolase [Kiritimatiellia bacterium]